MSNMKLAVLGAGGRMGGALIRAISETEGATLAEAIEREGSPALGKTVALPLELAAME